MSERIIAGRYRVLKNKGDNGLCTTHFVEDSLTGASLVVKVFALTDPLGIEYIKTANLLRDSEPRGIALVLDGGLLDEEEGFFSVYPLLDSHSLDDYLRVIGNLTISELKRIMASLMQAVNELHTRGFLHLFLNPRNVFFTPGTEVTIKDPGLSAEMFTPLLEHLPSYDYSFFSPELMDSPGTAGRLADVFALGRVLENMLEHLESKDMEEAEKFECDRIRQIAQRCTAVDPSERYEEVSAIIEDIQREIETESPAEVAEDTPSYVSATAAPFETVEDAAFFDLDLETWGDESSKDIAGMPVGSHHSWNRSRRSAGSPLLKLLLLALTLAAAVTILIFGYDPPGKSARTSDVSSGNPNTEGEVDASQDDESMDKQASGLEENDAGSSTPILFADTGQSPTIPAASETTPGSVVGQSEIPDPEVPDTSDSGGSGALAPVAAFTYSPDAGASPLQVYLDASGSYDPDGTIVSFAWSFGASGPATYHVFESNILPCALPVTLTVTDGDGLTASVTHYITVY